MSTLGDIEEVELAIDNEDIEPGDKIKFKFFTSATKKESFEGIYKQTINTTENSGIVLMDERFFRADRIVVNSIQKVS